jgi:repressor LexA
MKPASQKQLDIVSYIRRYQEQHGFAPSIREIGERFILASPSTVKHHLDALEAKGYIKRLKGAARAIKVLKG